MIVPAQLVHAGIDQSAQQLVTGGVELFRSKGISQTAGNGSLTDLFLVCRGGSDVGVLQSVGTEILACVDEVIAECLLKRFSTGSKRLPALEALPVKGPTTR